MRVPCLLAAGLPLTTGERGAKRVFRLHRTRVAAVQIFDTEVTWYLPTFCVLLCKAICVCGRRCGFVSELA